MAEQELKNLNEKINYSYYVLIGCIIILLILLFNCYKKTERFSGRPTEKQKEMYINEMMTNRNLFDIDMYTARDKMPWLDAITYEDTRKLIRENNFNKQTLLNILN